MATASSDLQRSAPWSWWSRVQGWFVRRKGYSLVPVQQTQSRMLRPGPRPGDETILRAFGESPFLHIKYLRLCSKVASVNLGVFAQKPDLSLERLRDDHPLARLLDEPNPFLDGWSFRFLTELYVRVTQGGCYWRIIRDGLRVPSQLWLYPAMWVRPVRQRGIIANYQLRDITGATITERPENILWLRTPDPLDPYAKGLGDALSVATELDTYELASESDRQFFANDATPPGALVVPGTLTPDERDRLNDDWMRRVGGVQNAGSVPILYGGMEYKQFRQGRKEMDFIDGQRFLRDVILVGVHKHIVGITDDVNLANAKAADYTMAVWEIAPRIPWWEHHYKKIAQLYDPRLRVKLENPVPEDEEFELRRASEGLRIGALKRNEWRRANRFDEVPDGDVYLLPMGTVEIPAAQGRASRNGGKAAVSEPTCAKGAVISNAAPAPERTTAPNLRAHLTKRLSDGDIEAILRAIMDDDFLEDMRGAYETVMASRWKDAMEEIGIDIAFDRTHPRVLEYIRNEAGQRITRIDDTTRDAIKEQLEQGIAAGEGIRDLADRIEAVFDEAKGRRAVMIARTETIDASNAAAVAAYKESRLVEKVEWLLAPDYNPDDDDGECGEIADRGPVLLGEEFAPGIQWPPAHVNCLLPGNRVRGRFVAGLRAWYAGPVWEIETARGHRLTVTPNHPIATPQGLIPAHLLSEGMNVFCDTRNMHSAMMVDNQKHGPSLVEYIFEALAANGIMATREIVDSDLHGDAVSTNHQVEIVRAHRILEIDAVTQGAERSGQFAFVAPDMLQTLKPRSRRFHETFPRLRTVAGGHPGGLQLASHEHRIALQPAPLFSFSLGSTARTYARIPQGTTEPMTASAQLVRQCLLGFARHISRDDSRWQGLTTTARQIRRPPQDGIFADSKSLHQRLETFACEITTTQVVKVRQFDFVGHVYDLQSDVGVMIAEGIGISNCRCAVAPLVFEEEEEARAARSVRRKRHERPRWQGDERKEHITALGQEHARLERLFKAKLKRAFQHQQNAVLRKLRELDKA